MKLLKNKLLHMKDMLLTVNETQYKIDADRQICVSDADAEKLLRMSEWEFCYDIQNSSPEPEVSMVEDPDYVSPEESCTADDLDIVMVDEDVVDDVDWPTPNSTMKKSYLQEMARAYGIDPGEKTKMQLIIAIKGIMFE